LNHFRHPLRYRQLPTPHRKTALSLSLASRLKRNALYVVLALALGSVAAVGLLRFAPAPTSAFMLHEHIDDWVDGKGYRPIEQHWVGAKRISKHAFAAVIASEDQRFYQHHGFDVDAIYQAYDQYQRGGKLRGASTISQQVAKNLFLSPARNFGRKALEIWFTFLIESLWSKGRILEVYLNVAEFGDHLYGIEAASRRYFGISASQLSANQAALLAATLPNPRLFKADKPSAYVYRRQNWILGQMRNLATH